MESTTGVQISMTIWKEMLKSIPNFFEALEQSKNYSFHYDTVVRDLKFTHEALVITPPDSLAQAFELELEKKQIPFVKSTADIADKSIKASGFYVYYCRTMDTDRVYESVTMINEKVLNKWITEQGLDNNESKNKEAEPEREREKETDTQSEPESSEDEEKEADHSDADEEDIADETADDDSEKADKKKKKEKKKSHEESTSAVANHTEPIYDYGSYDGREKTEREAEQRAEEQRRREESQRRQQEDDRRNTTNSSASEAGRNAEYSQEKERERLNKEREAERERERQNAERTTAFSTERREQYETRAQKTDEQQDNRPRSSYGTQRGTEIHRSAGADGDSSIKVSFGNHAGFSREDSSTKQQDEAHIDRGAYTQRNVNVEKANGKEVRPGSGQTKHAESGSPALNSDSKSAKPDFTQPQSSTKSDTGNVRNTFAEQNQTDVRHTSYFDSSSEQQPFNKGKANDANPTASDKVSSAHTAESGKDTSLGSGPAILNDIPQGNSQTYIPGIILNQEPENDSIVVAKGSLPVGYEIFDVGSSKSGGFVSYVEGKPEEIGARNIKWSESVSQKEAGSISGKYTNRGIQDAVPTKNAKQIARTVRRTVTQTVINRETDGGRAAAEAMENTSPIASALISASLSHGAMNLTRQTKMGSATLNAFYSVAHSCNMEEAEEAVSTMLSSLPDFEHAGDIIPSMYEFSDAAKLDENGIEELNQRIEALKTKFSEMQTGEEMSLEKLEEFEAVKNELTALQRKQSILKVQKMFMAEESDGFGLRSGETFSEWFARADTESIIRLIGAMDISNDLKAELASMHFDSDDVILKLEALQKRFGGNKNDADLIAAIQAGKLSGRYHGGLSGVFSAIRKIGQRNLFKIIAGGTDAGRAIGEVSSFVFSTYATYKAGMRLFLHTLRQFKIVSINSGGMMSMFGKEISKNALINPLGAAKDKAGKAAGKALGKGLDKIGIRKPLVQARRAVIRHASNALKFLTKPITAPVKKIIVKLGIDKLAASASAKLASFAAAASSVLGWLLVIGLGLAIVFEVVDSTQKAEEAITPKGIYNDEEIIQEVITELTQKNVQFMSDINNAANHRGEYSTTTNLTTNENVSFYEQGAYNIVFRDAETGAELEPSHVDLNNTKAILAMASRYLPYPLKKPSDNASESTKKDYEDMAQHFKDYCYFLWAATHQISIEEYHPGNSDNVEGATDNSGLQTTADLGKCEKDGTTLWLKSNFQKDIIHWRKKKSSSVTNWICGDCDDVPETGLGLYRDDLCTHGKDGNAHGGWRMTGNKRTVYNCQESHHIRIDDDDQVQHYDCEELGCNEHKHTEYEWVYDCGGHMGAVVYVTIGDLSRDPAFAAAKDVDYDAVGEYNTGDSLSGSDIVNDANTTEESAATTE